MIKINFKSQIKFKKKKKIYLKKEGTKEEKTL